MNYLGHIVVIVNLYIILAVSLNLLVAQAGLMSVAHAAFYGIGAYTAGVMATHFSVNFTTEVGIALILGSALSAGVSFPSLRVRGDVFAIATLTFQVVVWQIFNNWTDVTHGPLGLPGIPPPAIFGWRLESQGSFVVLTTVLAILVVLFSRNLISSPFGRVLRGICEDETFVLAQGKSVAHFKIVTVMACSAVAAVAGCIYAHYVTFVDPSSFTVAESMLILSMAIIGGRRGGLGVVAGASLLVLLPESLRFLGIPGSALGHWRELIYSTILLSLLLSRPQEMTRS